jgi:MFS family permease
MKKPFVLYCISEVFLSLGLGIVLYALPFLYKSAGLSDATIGLLLATNAAVSGVSALLLGSVADRIGASKVVKIATLLLGLSYLFTAFGHRASMWLVTSSVSGLGGALLTSTENVVLTALTQNQEKARLLSRFFAMYTFVMGVGSIVAGPICAYASYRVAIFLGAAIALVAPVIRYFVRVEDVTSSRMFKLPSRRLLAMCAYAMIFGIATGLFNPFATLILKAQFGIGDNIVAPISAASTLMMSLGGFAVAPLLRHLKHERTLLLSFALSIVFTLGLVLLGNVYAFLGLYLLRTASTSVPGSIVDATFLNITTPTEYSQMFGVRIFGNNVGTAIGSLGGGYLLTNAGRSVLYATSAVVFAVACTYLMILLRKLRHTSAMTSVPLQDSSMSK